VEKSLVLWTERMKERINQWIEVNYKTAFVHSELEYLTLSLGEFEEFYGRQIPLDEAA
jgi:hypothetical protein